MKKRILSVLLALLLVFTAAGCGDQPDIQETEQTTETTQAPTLSHEELTEYYTQQVYAQQIGRYYTALTEYWDIDRYYDNGMSNMPYFYYFYDGQLLDNIGFGFVDLNKDDQWELVIGAIWGAEADPIIFELWTLVDGQPVMVAQSGNGNRYILQHDPQEQAWYVANEVSYNMANWGTYYLTLAKGKLELMYGVVFNDFATQQTPWFKATDLDWDSSNDQPIDEQTAQKLQEENRELYTTIEYKPYSSIHSGQPLPSLEQYLKNTAADISQRYGVDIRIPEQSQLEYSHYEAYELTDLASLRVALDTLEATFRMYPEGFFRQLSYGNVETVRIELVGGLTVKPGVDIDPGSVSAFAQDQGSYYLVVLSSYGLSSATLFHEFSHVIDARLKWDSINRTDALYSEAAWLALQPEGFAYASSYTIVPDSVKAFLQTDYFINWYALTFPTEDRATLLEAAMSNSTEYFAADSGRIQKLRFYAQCIRDGFDTTGWPEVTLWEQVLQ